jgi:hypothetical protein
MAAFIIGTTLGVAGAFYFSCLTPIFRAQEEMIVNRIRKLRAVKYVTDVLMLSSSVRKLVSLTDPQQGYRSSFDYRAGKVLKRFIAFLQVIGSMQSYSSPKLANVITFPKFFKELFNFLDLVTSVVQFPAMACYTNNFSLLAFVLFNGLGPLVLAVVLFIPTGILWLLGKHRSQGAETEIFRACWLKAAKSIAFWWFLIHPITSKNLLAVLECVDVNDGVGPWLRTDFGVSCNSEKYLVAYSLACFFILVWVIGGLVVLVGGLFFFSVPKIAKIRRLEALYQQFCQIFLIKARVDGVDARGLTPGTSFHELTDVQLEVMYSRLEKPTHLSY